jgi:hypothetical protein
MNNYPENWPKGSKLRGGSYHINKIRIMVVGIVGVDEFGVVHYDTTNPDLIPMFELYIRRISYIRWRWSAFALYDGELAWSKKAIYDNLFSLLFRLGVVDQIALDITQDDVDKVVNEYSAKIS